MCQTLTSKIMTIDPKIRIIDPNIMSYKLTRPLFYPKIIQHKIILRLRAQGASLRKIETINGHKGTI